jgi:mannose-1-phosphate guanylyltransferase/mannose-6-phosphate isomerase
MDIIALILAGGGGTRLWPLSRKLFPKQLLSLTGSRSLLQETSRRILPLIDISNQWIITNNDLYNQVKSQMGYTVEGDIDAQYTLQVLKEPEAKSTAPAIIWSALRCSREYGNDAIMVVLPSDHLVLKEKAFLDALNKAVLKAGEGLLITFGVVPDYPETGYGYIKTSKETENDCKIYKVESFAEKPDLKTAESFVENGSYLWNSGIFVFQVGTLLEEASKYCPDIYNAFSQIDPYDDSEVRNAFNSVKPISIDYAVMEFTKKACVIEVDMGWSDIGSWKSLYEVSDKDESRNVIEGEHIVIDTTDCYIYGKDRLIASIGLSNVAIIDTMDALLVVPLDQAYRIREVVDRLQAQNSRLHIEHTAVERP